MKKASTTMSIRGISLFVKVIGHGYPLVLMHGGPSLDYTTLLPLQPLADQFTLIFYDHRCNGRSAGPEVTSMTFENLTADADALRQALGFDRWAVLGHSFGGHVALEYALRYPQSVSHLILMDTGGDQWWVQQNVPEILAKRGYSAGAVQAARRFYSGQITPREYFPTFMKFMSAYNYDNSLPATVRGMVSGHMPKFQPEALIFGHGQLLNGWTVMDRLNEIRVPTLVLAGRHDFLYPPEHQVALTGGIPNARLQLIDRAGHNPHMERPAEVLGAIRDFMSAPAPSAPAGRKDGQAVDKPLVYSASYASIDAYVEQQMRRLNMPAVSLAIVEGDEIVHLRGFGEAGPDGVPPSPQTPFFIGSLTKSFTALAVMQLVEAGKVELDAPVQRYVPWFRVADPRASAEMTLRHLLNQTSGLPEWAGDIPLADFDESPGAAERQARELATLELTRPIGAACEYCNANYNLLGLIIEATSGETYAEYIHNHILVPLGMSRTYISPEMAQQNGLATGHQYWFSIPFAAPNMPIPRGSLAAGMLISSAQDMARYLIAYLNGGRHGDAQILSPAGIDEMHRGAAEYRKMGISAGKYGMGWFDGEIGGKRVVWHSGTLPHFAAHMALLPEQKKGVVLLFNANHHWYVPVLIDFGMGVTALLAGEPPPPPRVARIMPWMLRGQLLIPVLQKAGIATTLQLLRGWHLDPGRQPSGGRKWGLHVLAPLIPNLLLALTLKPVLGRTRRYLKLYMPDSYWIAMICGCSALAWSVLRTGLVLAALRRRRSSLQKGEQPLADGEPS